MSDNSPEHEAGHVWLGWCLGWSCTASVRGGSHVPGCTIVQPPYPEPALSDRSVPFVLRPAGERDYLTGHALVALAGEIADEVLLWRGGRLADPIAERAGALAEALPEDEDLPPVAEDDRRLLAEYMDDASEPDDAVKAARWSRKAHGGDLICGTRWLAWLEAEARRIITADATHVRLVAAALARDGELSSAAIPALLAGIT